MKATNENINTAQQFFGDSFPDIFTEADSDSLVYDISKVVAIYYYLSKHLRDGIYNHL